MNKQGILGAFIATFISTIIILLILVLFVFASSILKIAGYVPGEVEVFDSDELGLEGVENYISLSYHSNFLGRYEFSKKRVLEVSNEQKG